MVVEHLFRVGLSLPSLYLERGGRLRCLAVRGYWQVFDGMPVDAGVIGATFQSGRPVELRGVSGSVQYLAVAPAVVDEVCVPIVAAARAYLRNTISVGIAVARPGEQAAAVLDRADRALYQVKRAGRNDAHLAQHTYVA